MCTDASSIIILHDVIYIVNDESAAIWPMMGHILNTSVSETEECCYSAQSVWWRVYNIPTKENGFRSASEAPQCHI